VRFSWGSQVEAPLGVSRLRDTQRPFLGIFIHTPVITELLPVAHEPLIEVISCIPESLLPDSTPDGEPAQSVVALRQGRHLLTMFHPELTGDSRFHEYFVQGCMAPSLLISSQEDHNTPQLPRNRCTRLSNNLKQ